MESDNNSVHVASSNDVNECDKGQDECNESIDNGNLALDCEEVDFRFCESNDCSQYEEDGYVTKNESCDSVYEDEEISHNIMDNLSCDEMRMKHLVKRQ